MTSNVNNTGIAHLAFRAGGEPFCKNRRPHACVTVGEQRGYRICKRCVAKWEKMQSRDAAKRKAT